MNNQYSQQKGFVDSYFDKIYVINLDRRKDRLVHIQEELVKSNINTAQRVVGVDLSDEELSKIPKEKYLKFRLNTIAEEDKEALEKRYIKGQLGCRASHISCILDAKKNGYNRILILEDDVSISRDINANFSSVIENNGNDWDLLYLGGDYWDNGAIYQTSSYAVQSSIYDLLIDSWISSGEEVDFCLVNNVQGRVRTRKVFPPLINQLKIDSDIPTMIVKSPTISMLDPSGPIHKNQTIKYSNITIPQKEKRSRVHNKNLFSITISEYGKPQLRKIIDKFGHKDFDYLLFVYDDTRFDEKEFEKCEIIYEKKLKWEYAETYLTKDRYEKYDYIFFWDEDVDILDFNYKNFLDIMDVNCLDLAQPALDSESYSSWLITIKNKGYKVGRFTNFVECGPALIFSPEGLEKYLDILDTEINKWGWGYDVLASTIGGIERMGIIDSESVRHIRPVTSINTTAPQEMYELFKKYNKFEYDFFVHNNLFE